jgi:hypothetical protein
MNCGDVAMGNAGEVDVAHTKILDREVEPVNRPLYKKNVDWHERKQSGIPPSLYARAADVGHARATGARRRLGA